MGNIEILSCLCFVLFLSRIYFFNNDYRSPIKIKLKKKKEQQTTEDNKNNKTEWSYKITH